MSDVTAKPVVDLDLFAGDESATGPAGLDVVDEQLIAQLAGRARAGGLALTGQDGLLAQLTKRLVESALEGEITDHLGYERHDATAATAGTPATDTAPRPHAVKNMPGRKRRRRGVAGRAV